MRSPLNRAALLPLLAIMTLGADCRRAPPDTADSADTDDTSTIDPGAPAALVVDGANSRYRFVRLDTGEVLHELDLTAVAPELCPGTEEFVCVAYGAEHAVSEAGEDLLLVVFTRVQIVQNNHKELGGVVQRYKLGEGGGELLWSLESLDFLTNFEGSGLCAQESACTVPPAEDYGQGQNEISAERLCRLSNTHDVELIEDDGGAASFWVADTGDPSRVLKIRLDSGETCGVVEDAIGDELNEDWLRFANTNDVDRYLEDGVEMLLVNHKASLPLYDDGHAGRGKSTLWRRGDAAGDWSLVWEHPARDAEVAAYLNAPHNSDRVEHPDGSTYAVFAHSNGDGAHFEDQQFDPNTDHYGSVGVLRMDGDGATYLFDAVLPDGAPLNFIRDVDYVPELDAWLVTDSGCNDHITVDCERPMGPRLLSFAPSALAPADGQDGRWSADKAELNQVEVTERQDIFPSPLECGFDIPYESDWIWERDMGAFLSGRLGAPIGACE